MSRRKYRLSVFFLLLAALLLSACSLRKYIAATMRLVKTEGTVQVDNARGESVEIMENLGLYSGYGVTTQAASYGWINLDETKLAKMDASSQVGILKRGKLLEIYVESGSLYFNVTEPLKEDETMNIRTSNMMVGIRGTSGWVEVEDKNRMSVYLLKGEVECTVFGEKDKVLVSETITAGQSARMVYDGEEAFITTEEFSNIPDFVEEAINNPEAWNLSLDEESGEEEESDSSDESDMPAISWEESGLEDHVMNWNDDYLEAIMRKITGISDRDIMLSDVWERTSLNLYHDWDLGETGLTDISALGELINLTDLDINSHQQLTDFSPLANLTNLTDLRINQVGVSDLGFLENLVNLKRLQMRYNSGISDLGPLSSLTNLESLELESSHTLSDLSPLANLTNLNYLWVVYCQVSDLSPLANLTNLDFLNLMGNQISDLSPLANLTNLKSGLGLDGNQISDVSPLSGLTKLEKLYLNGNPIQDITPVLFVPELYYDEFAVDEGPGAEEGEYPSEEELQNGGSGTSSLLADYVGTYTPYPAYDYYSKGSPVTLNENGVVTGGAMNIVYHADPAASGGWAQN